MFELLSKSTNSEQTSFPTLVNFSSSFPKRGWPDRAWSRSLDASCGICWRSLHLLNANSFNESNIVSEVESRRVLQGSDDNVQSGYARPGYSEERTQDAACISKVLSTILEVNPLDTLFASNATAYVYGLSFIDSPTINQQCLQMCVSANGCSKPLQPVPIIVVTWDESTKTNFEVVRLLSRYPPPELPNHQS